LHPLHLASAGGRPRPEGAQVAQDGAHQTHRALTHAELMAQAVEAAASERFAASLERVHRLGGVLTERNIRL